MRIKVLHYGLSYNNGGIENVVYSWFKNKPKSVTFDFLNDGNLPLAYEEEFVKGGSKIHHIVNRYSNPVKRFLQLKEIVKREEYDYIHMHIMNMDEIGPIIICNNSERTKAIIHCHGTVSHNNTIKEQLLINEFKLFSIWNKFDCISCSRIAGEKMFKKKPFDIIENGIDFKKYSFSDDKRMRVRNEFNIEESEKIIGHIGHDCVEKNYPFLIPVVAELMKRNKKYRFMLIGNVCTSDEILNMLKKYDIYNRTLLVGRVPDTSRYYSAMDAFFLPSHSEGFPVSLVEAQVSGLGCVTSVNVTKETKITKNISFCDFSIEENLNALENILNSNINRNNVDIDDKLNIVNTTNKLMRYYFEHKK